MPRTPRTICVVEDDESVRRALRRLMRAVELPVEVVASAEEFLQAGVQAAAACLILDLHLPGLSGLELQERLRAEGRAVPIVFITAYGDPRVRERALQAGALAFLEKPFAEQSLLDAVERAVRQVSRSKP